MHRIAFMNQKGGVGKTTTTVSVGSILAHRFGKRVLLIDLDPQGNLSDHVGIDPNELERSVYNVLVDEMAPEEVLQTRHGMDILPANLDLSAAEVELASMMSRELRLKRAVEPLLGNYDYVLLDCPPSLGLLTISGLAFAHEVIVPMEAEYLALRGLSQLVQTIALVDEHLNEGIEVTGVVFCGYDGRTLLAQGVRQEVESFFPGKVYETVIRKNVRLAEAPSFGQPIDVYDPVCRGAKDYLAVTQELLRRRKESDAPSPQPAVTSTENTSSSDSSPAAPAEEAEEAEPGPVRKVTAQDQTPPRREPVWKGDEPHKVVHPVTEEE